MRRVTLLLLAAAALAGAFVLGRATAPVHRETYDEGVSVGRALQAGASLPAGTRDVATQAFRAGYRSGLADSFGGYDGGWILGRPYAVVLAKGTGDRPYTIDQRELLRPGASYRICTRGAGVCSS